MSGKFGVVLAGDFARWDYHCPHCNLPHLRQGFLDRVDPGFVNLETGVKGLCTSLSGTPTAARRLQHGGDVDGFTDLD